MEKILTETGVEKNRLKLIKNLNLGKLPLEVVLKIKDTLNQKKLTEIEKDNIREILEKQIRPLNKQRQLRGLKHQNITMENDIRVGDTLGIIAQCLGESRETTRKRKEVMESGNAEAIKRMNETSVHNGHQYLMDKKHNKVKKELFHRWVVEYYSGRGWKVKYFKRKEYAEKFYNELKVYNTEKCQWGEKLVEGKRLTLIDTIKEELNLKQTEKEIASGSATKQTKFTKKDIEIVCKKLVKALSE
jgi:hypothetical protein